MEKAFFGQECSCGGGIDRAGQLIVRGPQTKRGVERFRRLLAWKFGLRHLSLRGVRDSGGAGWKDRGMRHDELAWQDHAGGYFYHLSGFIECLSKLWSKLCRGMGMQHKSRLCPYPFSFLGTETSSLYSPAEAPFW